MRTLVEDAAVAALVPLLVEDLGGAAGGYLKKVAAYQGSLSPQENDRDLAELLLNGTPCIGVTTGDGDFGEHTMGDRPQATLGFLLHLLVASGNQRSDEAKARGDGISSDPGLYQISEDIRAKLWLDLGVAGAGITRPRAEVPILRSGKLALWRYDYSIDTDATAADPDAGAVTLDSYEIQVNEPDETAANPVLTARGTINP